MTPRHLLDLEDIPAEELRKILTKSVEFKADFKAGDFSKPEHRLLERRYVALLFEWPATRTRLHLETATRDLGGDAIAFYARDMPLSRGESIGDTAKVLSRHCAIILHRTGDHQRLLEMAANSTVPVINGCTSYSHPFRILVEVMSYEEERQSIEGRTITYIGDCRVNYATSWIHGAVKFGAKLRMACPPELAPRKEVLEWAERSGGDIKVYHDKFAAAEGADYLLTDIWVPFGQDNREERVRMLEPFRIDASVMKVAKPDALFMHPLAANRGDEVTDEVLDGPQSITWTGGIENKRHLLKALFMWLERRI